MKTKIIGVLGLGIFGQTLAQELSNFEQDVIAIDSNPLKMYKLSLKLLQKQLSETLLI